MQNEILIVKTGYQDAEDRQYRSGTDRDANTDLGAGRHSLFRFCFFNIFITNHMRASLLVDDDEIVIVSFAYEALVRGFIKEIGLYLSPFTDTDLLTFALTASTFVNVGALPLVEMVA